VKQAKIANLKDNLSRYLEHVRRGGSVLVLDRDRPVARLVPLPHDGAPGATERLSRLERQGLIRRGTGGRSAASAARKPLRLPGGVLRGLLEERERGW
jgi:antitoxin (DNA-binding transcriptional repressor) of toxin-antitoxin stability system